MNWKFTNSKHKARNTKEIIDILLENRGIILEEDKKEFFKPRHPRDFSLRELEIDEKEMEKAVKRIALAKKNKETVLIYGDYDADGVSATAVLWEVLHASGFNVYPFIPDRFADGYGINSKRVVSLMQQLPNLRLIITVDNGIVATKQVEEIKKLGIEVIITDHHQKGEIPPNAMAIVHTDLISGSGVSWVLAHELFKKRIVTQEPCLDMVAIGTVADVLPLIRPNRSFVKYGLEELNQAKRPGIAQLCAQAGMNADNIGVYEIGFVIAPRLNSMGRLKNALDSLRLVCTKKLDYAQKKALEIAQTNQERQRIVEEVMAHAGPLAEDSSNSVLVIAHESYHEGVIGLAAAKLVERYYRPAIVIAKGETIAKASARSIEGFNIIENIRKVQHLIIEGGGHPSAAGFTIELSKIEEFTKAIQEEAQKVLTQDVLQRTLPVDLELQFDCLHWELMKGLKQFEPTGSGNKQPVFATAGVEVVQCKTVGQEGKHLKLQLRQGTKTFDSIGFGLGKYATSLSRGHIIDVAYCLEENTWNGNTVLQLKVKDIHFGDEHTAARTSV